MNVPGKDFKFVHVCFLEPGGKGEHSYGILARTYDPTLDTCCTCMNLKGTLQVYGYKEIDKAIGRLKTKNEYCELKRNAPIRALDNVLLMRLSKSPPLKEVVAEAETLYYEGLELKQRLKKDTRTLKAVTAVKAPKKKTKPRARKGAKKTKRNMVAIEMGTDVAAWYYDSEMVGSYNEKQEILRAPSNDCTGPGRWYRGTVVGEMWTKQNLLVYHCAFDTPLQHKHWLTEAYTAKVVTSFNSMRELEGWDFTPRAPQDDEGAIVVGANICRWFPKSELIKDPSYGDNLMGAYIEGIVVDSNKINSVVTYKCSFDAPASSEAWFSEEDTNTFISKYKEQSDATTTERNTRGNDLSNLCKGAHQRAAVAEACGVVGRRPRIPHQTILESQVEHVDSTSEESEGNASGSHTALDKQGFVAFLKQITDATQLGDYDDTDSYSNDSITSYTGTTTKAEHGLTLNPISASTYTRATKRASSVRKTNLTANRLRKTSIRLKEAARKKHESHEPTAAAVDQSDGERDEDLPDEQHDYEGGAKVKPAPPLLEATHADADEKTGTNKVEGGEDVHAALPVLQQTDPLADETTGTNKEGVGADVNPAPPVLQQTDALADEKARTNINGGGADVHPAPPVLQQTDAVVDETTGTNKDGGGADVNPALPLLQQTDAVADEKARTKIDGGGADAHPAPPVLQQTDAVVDETTGANKDGGGADVNPALPLLQQKDAVADETTGTNKDGVGADVNPAPPVLQQTHAVPDEKVGTTKDGGGADVHRAPPVLQQTDAVADEKARTHIDVGSTIKGGGNQTADVGRGTETTNEAGGNETYDEGGGNDTFDETGENGETDKAAKKRKHDQQTVPAHPNEDQKRKRKLLHKRWMLMDKRQKTKLLQKHAVRRQRSQNAKSTHKGQRKRTKQTGEFKKLQLEVQVNDHHAPQQEQEFDANNDAGTDEPAGQLPHPMSEDSPLKRRKLLTQGLNILNSITSETESKDVMSSHKVPNVENKRRTKFKQAKGTKQVSEATPSREIVDATTDSEYYMWKGEWYRWEESYQDTEWNGTKKKRTGPTNTRLRNWMQAMRRNMKPDTIEAALKPFTITRENIEQVLNV